MWYCPSLDGRIRRLEMIESGHSWEMQIRGAFLFFFPFYFPLVYIFLGHQSTHCLARLC
jgi:hypothetical protein